MKTLLVTLSAAVALSACAASDPRSSSPALVLSSKRPAKESALCIASAWDKLSAPANVRETERGFSVYWVNTGLGHVALLVDIERTETQLVTTTFRKNFALGVSRHESAIKDCQN